MEYHWIHGREKPQPVKASDVYLSVKEKKIVISPICLSFSEDKLIESTRRFIQPLLKK
jgi:hypothetical protein